jgi:hypothetical protein
MSKSTPLVLPVVVLLSLAFVLSAYADRPVLVETSFDSSGPLLTCTDPEDPSTCRNYCSDYGYDIEVTDHFWGTVPLRQWYNDAGQMVKEFDPFRPTTVQETFTGVISGRTLRANDVGPVHWRVIAYYPEGSFDNCPDGCVDWYAYITGPGTKVVVPGVGPVHGSTGRSVALVRWTTDNLTMIDWQDVSHSGPTWDSPVAFCAALAP